MELGKTEKILRTLSPERKREIGEEIEHLLRTDMRYIAHKYVNQFRVAAFDTFGWTREDLMQQVRITMWKGLATFDPSKKFKITTYLSAILFHYFMSLSKKCRSNKNAKSKLVCVEDGMDAEMAVDDFSLDELMDSSESMSYFLGKLKAQELDALTLLYIERKNVTEVSRSMKLSKQQVSDLTRSIKTKLRDHIRELEDEEDQV